MPPYPSPPHSPPPCDSRPRHSRHLQFIKKEYPDFSTQKGWTFWSLSKLTNHFQVYRILFEDNFRYRSFSLSLNKKINWKPSGGRSQENECYRRLMYKQFFQVSGLCGPQFLSSLPKRFTHLCRALYGDAILYRFGLPIWPLEIKKKNIWSSLFL